MDRVTDDGLSDDELNILESLNEGWEDRAKDAYNAALASSVDAVMHYHVAATEILETQRARKLTGRKQLSQEEIGRRLGIGQPAVSKLLAWERKYGAQVGANEGVPLPSPYYSPPPVTPEQLEVRKTKKSLAVGVAAEAQRQYQEVQRDYEDRLRALTAELAKKEDLLAELDTGADAFPLVPAPGKSAPEVEEAILALLAHLPADEKLEAVRRVEARLLAQQGSSL